MRSVVPVQRSKSCEFCAKRTWAGFAGSSNSAGRNEVAAREGKNRRGFTVQGRASQEMIPADPPQSDTRPAISGRSVPPARAFAAFWLRHPFGPDKAGPGGANPCTHSTRRVLRVAYSRSSSVRLLALLVASYSLTRQRSPNIHCPGYIFCLPPGTSTSLVVFAEMLATLKREMGAEVLGPPVRETTASRATPTRSLSPSERLRACCLSPDSYVNACHPRPVNGYG